MKVLLVEDSESDAALVQQYLQDAATPVEVVRCVDLRSAREALSTFVPDCLLVDLTLPDAQQLQAVDTLIATAPDLPLVVVTSLQDDELGVLAVGRGAQDFLSKSELSGPVLERSVRAAIERADIIRHRLLQSRREEAEELLGAIATEIAEANDAGPEDDIAPRLMRLTARLEHLRGILVPAGPETPSDGGGGVDLRPVVDRALSLLDTEIRQAGADVAVDRLPVLECDADAVLEIMLGLLRAALRAARFPGRVRVSARWDVDAWILEVADNGSQPGERAGIARLRALELGSESAQTPHLEGVRRVVDGEGGIMWTTSSDLGGTAVRVRLPGPAL